MMSGIDPKSETHKDTKNMLFSLRDILEQANPDWLKSRITYLEFLKDPWQKKSSDLKKETEQTKELHSMVKFIEITEQILGNKDKYTGPS